VGTTKTHRKRVTIEQLEKDTWTGDFRYSWRKMEATAKDTAGWRQVVCGLWG